jgi:hypothetical protein
MKVRRRLFLLLLPFLLPTLSARSIKAPTPGSVLVKREAATANAPVEAAIVPGKANPVGTKDAPVDGKDGLPHQGPFVETSAERDRKRTKESDDQELAVTPLRESFVEHAIERDTPISNDGVMDDPNRLGPKEGTRGTEGGVSEKSKDSKYGDKVPDPPKKEPPLPQSEVGKLGAERGPKAIAEEEKKLLEVRKFPTPNVNSGRRILIYYSRNPQTCPRSLTTSLHQTILYRTKTARSNPMMACQAIETPSTPF